MQNNLCIRSQVITCAWEQEWFTYRNMCGLVCNNERRWWI